MLSHNRLTVQFMHNRHSPGNGCCAAAAASLLLVEEFLDEEPGPIGDGLGGKVACGDFPHARRGGDSQPVEQQADVFAHAACRNDFHREKMLRGCAYDMQERVIAYWAPSPSVRET